jgi:glyoxylate/hydroxypyruvate reductase A
MALLIDVGLDGWITDDEIAAEVAKARPGLDIRTPASLGAPEEITMLACARLREAWPARLPALRLVQKLGAGVETIVRHPALPERVRVARLKPEEPARQIAEWVLTYVLMGQRNVLGHLAEQAQSRWTSIEPRQPQGTTAAVLGLGHIGGRCARLLQDMGFRVIGWSRSQAALDGIDCRSGTEALPGVLREADYVAAILPSTPETRHLIDADMLAAMKPGATFLNAGRGDLVDQSALVSALDNGPVGAAVLDVTDPEPLPADHPLWRHPKCLVTPHVSGWHLGDAAMADVAENFLRLTEGRPLLHEVDRARGY